MTASKGIPIDVAELAGIVAGGILYGAFCVLFGITIRILLRRPGHGGKINWTMLMAAVLLMAVATVQIVVDTVNIFLALIEHDTRSQRQFFLEDTREPIFAAKHATYFTMMLLGDVIVIHRCFVVWSNNVWVVVVPTLCSLGSAVSAYQTIWAVRHSTDVTIVSETRWGIAVLMLSMSANIIATSCLACRIWMSEKALRSRTGGYISTSSNHRRIVKIVLESGLVNAAYLIAYTTVLVLNNHGLQFIAGISTPMVGIIFSVVLVRAALATESQSPVPASTHSGPFRARNRMDDTSSESGVQIMVTSDGQHDSIELKARFTDLNCSNV